MMFFTLGLAGFFPFVFDNMLILIKVKLQTNGN